MLIRIHLDAVDVTAKAILSGTRLQRDLNGRKHTFSFKLRVDEDLAPGYAGRTYTPEQYEGAYLGVSTVLVTRESDGEPIFRGVVASIKLVHAKREPNPVDYWQVDCDDLSAALDKIVVPDQTWENVTDASILRPLIASLLPGVTTDTIASLITVAKYEAKDATLRKVVNDLAQQSGADYWLSPRQEFWYCTKTQAPNSAFRVTDDSAAPDKLSATITGLTTNRQEYANRVVIIGAVIDVDGNRIRAEANDLAAQAERGRVEAYSLIVNEITTPADAQNAANSELSRRTNPQSAVSFWTRNDAGLDVGQVISIDSVAFGLNETFLVSSVSMAWETQSLTRYDIQAGTFRRNFVDVLAQIKRGTKGTVKPPIATVPDGSIDDGKISDVNASKVVGAITAEQIDTVNATQITGTINASQIHSVFATSISGPITSAQIQDLEVEKLSGLIQSNQIHTVSAEQITGTIQADQIDSVHTDSLVGTISGTNIGTLIIDNFPDGLITADKVDSVYISKIVVDGAWIASDVTLGGGSFYCDVGNITATTGTLRGAGFHHTGSLVNIADPDSWRSALNVPSNAAISDIFDRLTSLEASRTAAEAMLADLDARVSALEAA